MNLRTEEETLRWIEEIRAWPNTTRRLQMNLKQKTSPQRCSFCHGHLTSTRFVCSACGSSAHLDCYQEHGSCPTCSQEIEEEEEFTVHLRINCDFLLCPVCTFDEQPFTILSIGVLVVLGTILFFLCRFLT